VISHDAELLAAPHGRHATHALAGARPTPSAADSYHEFEYVHDVEGNLLDADLTAQELFGRGDAGITGLNVREIVAPQFGKLMDENIRERFANVDSTKGFDMVVITAKKEFVCVKVTAWLDEHKGKRCVKGVARIIDIPSPEDRRIKRPVKGAGFGLGLWDRNLDTDYNWVNQWLLAMIGVDKPELTFDELKRAIHPDDLRKVLNAMDEHINGKTQHYQCEYRILHAKDMRYRWVQSLGTVRKNRQGRPTHISGAMVDVTDRKEAESRFERLVDTDQNMIFVKDQEGRFLFINHAVEKLYNTSRATAVGKTDRDYCPDPKHVEHFRKHDQMVLNGEELKEPLLEQVTGVDGKVRWFRTTKVKFEWDGKPAVLGVATEVTDLIHEQHLNREQRELLESILKSVPIIIDCKELDGRYSRVNQAFLDFVGRGSFEEVIGKRVGEILPPDQASVVEVADQAVLAGKVVEPIEVTAPDKGKWTPKTGQLAGRRK
jgi:PAS domain S-box-containing protein